MTNFFWLFAMASRPPAKQARFDLGYSQASSVSTVSIGDSENSYVEVIFPSDSEDDISEECTSGEVFFPSEDEDCVEYQMFPSEEEDPTECEIFPSEEEDCASASEDASSSSPPLACTDSLLLSPREQELHKIAPILIASCCLKECLLNLTALDVLKLRSQFQQLNQTQQRQWLTDRMHENSHYCGDSLNTKFFISGIEVCKQAWGKVLDVSEKRINAICQSVSKGQVWKF